MSKPQVKPEDFMSILLEMTPSDIKSRTNISWHKVSVAFTLGWDTAISGVSNQGSMVKIIPKIFQLLNKENSQDALRILIYSAFSRDNEMTERDVLKRILSGKNHDDLKSLFTTIAQTIAKQMLIPTQESDITALVDSIISEHPELNSIRSLIEKRLREYTNGQTLKAELEKTGLLIPYLEMISDKREDNSAILKMLGAKDFEINTAVNEIREKANEKNLSTVKLESREYLLSSKMGIDLRSADQPLDFEKMIKGKENIANYQDLLDSNQSDSEQRELPEFIYDDDLSVKEDYLKLVLSARSKKLKMLFQLQGMFEISKNPPKNNKELLEQYQEVLKQALPLFELSKPSEQQAFLNGILEKLYPDLDGLEEDHAQFLFKLLTGEKKIDWEAKKQEAIEFLKIKENRDKLIPILKFFATADPKLKDLIGSQVREMLSSILPQGRRTAQDSTDNKKTALSLIRFFLDTLDDNEIISATTTINDKFNLGIPEEIITKDLINKAITIAESESPASTLLEELTETSPDNIKKIIQITQKLLPQEMKKTVEVAQKALLILNNRPLNKESIIKIIGLLPKIDKTNLTSQQSTLLAITIQQAINLAPPNSFELMLLEKLKEKPELITSLAPALTNLLQDEQLQEETMQKLSTFINSLPSKEEVILLKQKLLAKIFADAKQNPDMPGKLLIIIDQLVSQDNTKSEIPKLLNHMLKMNQAETKTFTDLLNGLSTNDETSVSLAKVMHKALPDISGDQLSETSINEISDFFSDKTTADLDALQLLHNANDEFINKFLADNSTESNTLEQARDLIKAVGELDSANGLKTKLKIVNCLKNPSIDGIENIVAATKALQKEHSDILQMPNRHQPRSMRRAAIDSFTSLLALLAIIRRAVVRFAERKTERHPPRRVATDVSKACQTALAEALEKEPAENTQETQVDDVDRLDDPTLSDAPH